MRRSWPCLIGIFFVLSSGCGSATPSSWRVVLGDPPSGYAAWTEGSYVTVSTELGPSYQVWALTHELSAHVAGLGHLPYPARSSVVLTMDIEPPSSEVQMLSSRGVFYVSSEPALREALIEACAFWNERCGRGVFVVI